MSVTRSQPISQTDMAALATLANTKLLPLVNEAVAMNFGPSFPNYSVWPGHGYDFYQPGGSASYLLQSPQPNYAFNVGTDDWLSEFNRIRGDLWNVLFGQWNLSGVGIGQNVVGSALYYSPNAICSGPWVVAVNDPDVFSPLNEYPNANTDAGTLYSNSFYRGIEFWGNATDLDGLDISATVSFSLSDTLNYVAHTSTTDFSFTLRCGFTTTATLRLNVPTDRGTSAITSISGASVTSQVNSSGTIQAVLAVNLMPGDTVINFTVSGLPGFEFDTNYPAQVSMDELTLSGSSDAQQVYTLHPTDGASRIRGPAYGGEYLFYIGSVPLPASIQFTLSDTKVKGLWIAKTLPVPAVNTFLDQDMPPYIGGALELANGSGAVQVGVSSGLLGAFANYYFDNPPGASNASGPPQYSNSVPILASSIRQQVLLRNGDEIELIMGVPGYPDGYPLDLGPKYNLIGQSNECRPASWLVRRDTDFVPFNFGYNPNDSESVAVNQTVAGDGTPMFGFANVGTDVVTLKLRLVQPHTTKIGWTNWQFGYGLPLTQNLLIFGRATTGTINPGDPTTYDFVTAINAVTITNDGGVGYMAKLKTSGILNFAIAVGIQRGPYNPSVTYHEFDLVSDPLNPGNTYSYINAEPSAGALLSDGDYWALSANVSFDLITEFNFVLNPQRQYFPPASECFSYCLDGTIGHSPVNEGWDGNKPVPQNGYCIYKVNARRRPVRGAAGYGAQYSATPASGPEIVVTLGQNQLQPDGTLVFAPFANIVPIHGAGDSAGGAGDAGAEGAGGSGTLFTFTIPATAGESGDVDVFIPVLGGNELVFQSDGDVIVEAWANWQPVWFAQIFGLYHSAGGYVADFTPTCFAFALNFTNWFSPMLANYGATGSNVQFPASIENYNDLITLLYLT